MSREFENQLKEIEILKNKAKESKSAREKVLLQQKAVNLLLSLLKDKNFAEYIAKKQKK